MESPFESIPDEAMLPPPSPPEGITTSNNEATSASCTGERYDIRNMVKRVMKIKVSRRQAKNAITRFNFEEGPSGQQLPGVMDELEQILRMDGVEWPTQDFRYMMISQKLDQVLQMVLMFYGYKVFEYYGENHKGRLQISAEPDQEPPHLPKWLQMPYLVPVKGFSTKYIPEACVNPAVQGGDRLYDKDHRPVGTLGTIMASKQPGRESITYIGLTAGHTIKDGDDALLVKDRKNDSFISLTVAPKSRRIDGRPVGRWGLECGFQDDVGLLIVDGDNINKFNHIIYNMNPYFMHRNSCPSLSKMLDPLSQPRRRDIQNLLKIGRIFVSKVGGETDLTTGYLVKIRDSPPNGWYKMEAVEGLGVGNESVNNSEEGEDSEGEEDDEDEGEEDNKDNEGDKDFEEWIGVVQWGDTPFSASGDSGSLVFAIEDGIKIPLGIHVGAPEAMPNHSVFISLETFCFEAEKEGLDLRFTHC